MLCLVTAQITQVTSMNCHDRTNDCLLTRAFHEPLSQLHTVDIAGISSTLTGQTINMTATEGLDLDA